MADRARECPFVRGVECPVRARALDSIEERRVAEQTIAQMPLHLRGQAEAIMLRPVVDAENVLLATRDGNCGGVRAVDRKLFPGLAALLGRGSQVVECGHSNVPKSWRELTRLALPPSNE